MPLPAAPESLPKAQDPSWSSPGVPQNKNTESLTLQTDRNTEALAGGTPSALLL